MLTTELATGARFAEVRRWDQARAATWPAETIFRFVFRSLYRLHAFNGDPHPGNYLFRPGGQVTFLDFGLVKRFDAATRSQPFQSMIRDDGARAATSPGSGAAVEHAGCCAPARRSATRRCAEYFGHFYEFVRADDRRSRGPRSTPRPPCARPSTATRPIAQYATRARPPS